MVRFFCVYRSKATGELEIGTYMIPNSVSERRTKRKDTDWIRLISTSLIKLNIASSTQSSTDEEWTYVEIQGPFWKTSHRHEFSRSGQALLLPQCCSNFPYVRWERLWISIYWPASPLHVCRCSWPPAAIFRALELPLADPSHIPVVRSLNISENSALAPPSKCFLL